MFIDTEVINKGLDTIYGRGTRAAVQAAKKYVPSAYKQMLRDTSPKGYDAVKRLADAIENGVRTGNTNKLARSGYRQMLKDTAPKARPITQDIVNKGLLKDGVYSKITPDKAKAINSELVKKAAIKKGPTGVKSYLPFVGDSILLGTGVHNIRHGHPWVGGAQSAIAAGGLTLDTLATLGTILSGGLASPAAAGVEVGKKGAEKALQKGLMKAATWAATKNTGKAATKRFLGGEALNVLPWLLSDTDTTTTAPVANTQSTTTPTKPTIKGTGRVGGGYAGGGGNYGYVNQGDTLGGKGNVGTPNGQLNYGNSTGDGGKLIVGDYTDEVSLANTPINPTEAQGDGQQGSNIDKLIQYYLLTHPDKKDYYNQLQNYAKDYSGLQQDAFNRDRYFAALSGLSGNNAYQKMMGSYNPAEIEATRLDLLNKAMGAQGEEYEGLGELIGNAAVARQIGLPEEAAFANKNLLTAYTGLSKAQYGLQGDIYKADVGRDAKLRATQMLVQCKQAIDQLDNQYKLEIAKGNWANAEKVAGIKAQVQAYASEIAAQSRRDVANINVAGFGNPQVGGQINPLLLQKYGLGE